MMNRRMPEWLKKNSVYLIVFVLIAIPHMKMVPYADDVWFSHALETMNFGEYLLDQYLTWTSRMLVAVCEIVFNNIPMLVWKVIDCFVYVGIAWLLGHLINERDRYTHLLACALWMTYPFIHMHSAGYVATTVNYSWPLLCVLTVCYLLKRRLTGVRTYWWENVLSIPALIYAANSEQGVAVLFGMYLIIGGICLAKKKSLPRIFYIQMILIVAILIFILTCPGNPARIAYETEHLFPQFAGFGLLRKVELGFTSAMYHFIFMENLVFFLFALVLWMTARRYARREWEKAVCATPLAVSICFSMFSTVFYTWFPSLEYLKNSLTETGTLFRGDPKTVIPCLIYLIVVASVLYGFYLFSRDSWRHTLLLFFVIAFGFGARMMLGFSASIWASSDRTYLFLYAAFMLAILYMIKTAGTQKLRTCILYLAALTGIATYTSFLVSFF